MQTAKRRPESFRGASGVWYCCSARIGLRQPGPTVLPGSDGDEERTTRAAMIREALRRREVVYSARSRLQSDCKREPWRRSVDRKHRLGGQATQRHLLIGFPLVVRHRSLPRARVPSRKRGGASLCQVHTYERIQASLPQHLIHFPSRRCCTGECCHARVQGAACDF